MYSRARVATAVACFALMTAGCSSGEVPPDTDNSINIENPSDGRAWGQEETWDDRPDTAFTQPEDTRPSLDISADTTPPELDTSGDPLDTSAPVDTSTPDSGPTFNPDWSTTHDVLVLNYDPIIQSSGKRAHAHFGWSDPRQLAQGYKREMHAATRGAITYKIVDWKNLDVYPKKRDGFRYDESSYKNCISNTDNCHKPDGVDYPNIINTHNLCQKVETGQIDEVWMFGAPYFGYWESTMVGDNGFWVNSSPVNVSCDERFIIMGFNYERGVAEMLHNFGHRLESFMDHVYRNWDGAGDDPYTKFRRNEGNDPGKARCGDTHFPPNGAKDYDYANQRAVQSLCHVYDNFPNLNGSPKSISCSAWNCTHRGYMKWMFRQVPDNKGMSDGYYNNWWKYLLEWEQFLDDGQTSTQDKHCGAYTSLNQCDQHRSRCGWFICADVCLKKGTEVQPVCDCAQNTTLTACNQDSGSCAWYACVNKCLPQGHDINDVCGSN